MAMVGWLGATFTRSGYLTGVGEAVQQRVPFSHKHHVGGLGIDCRYCHTTVETQAFAGFPPTKTCMGCHSQVWSDSPMLEPVRASWRTGESLQWNKVHRLADFVYFNHSIHVNKGIGCASCHGRIDQMPLVWRVNTLQMEWCLDCHRQPEKYVRPREHVYEMAWKPEEDQLEMGAHLVQEYKIQKLTNCSTCHR
jgi:Cytochrome c7 and related cytochrome c